VQVAQTLGTSQQTVTFWRGRFLREGMGGLAELARSGRPERIKPSLKGNLSSPQGPLSFSQLWVFILLRS